MTVPQSHRLSRMSGRDPHEPGRSATPLELLFDLTFVIAYGVAANELAHYLADDHVATAVVGFVFVTFAITWAWINFSWFASAFDTDDWMFRLTTMAQMLGVLVLALGIHDVFASIDEGATLDNRILVLGYVVMRVAMVVQWLRAARQSPERSAACRVYAATILVAQLGWLVLLVLETTLLATLVGVVVLVLVETAGPVLAETRFGGTPWHPHHIAERYGLLVIITLGEGMIGTMASLTAVVEAEGVTGDVALLGLAGVGMTFGMWWIYFVVPCGEILSARRKRSFGWGYGQIPFLGAAVAVGAGLHVAAYLVEDHTKLGTVATVLTVAVPLALYVGLLFALYAALTRSLDPFHLVLIASSAALLVGGVLLAVAGVAMTWCLLVLALTPWVTVVGYERVGHRHNERVLASL